MQKNGATGGDGLTKEDMVGAGFGHSKVSGGGGSESKTCRDAVLVALDLEELEKRVAACENADQLMQAGGTCTVFWAP